MQILAWRLNKVSKLFYKEKPGKNFNLVACMYQILFNRGQFLREPSKKYNKKLKKGGGGISAENQKVHKIKLPKYCLAFDVIMGKI